MPDIAIIGAGFSGLGTAIRLREQGIDDFVVLERHDDVGGTWWANTYPGCACDVPSHLYSFSFAPNPEWSRTYSSQPEIRAYLQRCAERYDLYRSIRLGVTVTAAAWDDAAGRWRLETSAGPVDARVLIAGVGPLAEPRVPDLPGLDRFEGTVFHSARWDHDHDVTGRRVAAIGTGASAIQFVPELQPKVARLHVFQRTPPWVMPHTTRPIRAAERRLYRRAPALQRAVRAGIYAGRELLVLGFAKHPRLMALPERIARRHLRSQVRDPALRARVTPDYTIGCKRILPSNAWYPALTRPNVELVTDAIAEVTAHGVVTADGTEREVDTIVFGTGFRATDMPVGRYVRGRGGRAARRRLGGQPAGAPRLHGGGVPQPVPAARPEHRAGAQLDGLHARVADRVRRRRAARDARSRRRDRRGPARGPGGLQPRARRPHGAQRVDHGLLELVPGRDRAQRGAVAGLDLALPAPDAPLRPGRARAVRRRARTGGGSGVSARLHRCLAEDVRTELYATGARPRTTALSGAGALTASERRVAALAAEGSSNRDIAQTLFVTPKTVEVHLSNVYRKLGIRSRRELGAALAPA